ncbi:hypothetical protein HRF87_14555 [Bacillus sp. CRN 9]|nr:hypothetical protein [Bacillus sp. CRN 9]
MNINDFKHAFSSVILERGRNYFNEGRIIGLDEVTKNEFILEVEGSSDPYVVAISLGDDGAIINCTCDCPFDWEALCKHQAASLFAIKEYRSLRSHSPVKKAAFDDLLERVNKNDLIQFIKKLSIEDANIETKFMYLFSQEEDLLKQSERLIKKYIKEVKHRQFISWNEVQNAVKGIEQTYEKALQQFELGHLETAIHLSSLGTKYAIDMFDYSDDSSGSLGYAVQEGISLINKVAIACLEQESNIQKQIYHLIIEEALKKQYDGWTEWRYDLIRSAMNFVGNEEISRELFNHIECLLGAAPEDNKYEIEEIKLLQLDWMQRTQDKTRQMEFIYANLVFHSFRTKAIQLELQEKHFVKVVDLCIKGIENPNTHRGSVSTWKEYLLEGYKGLENWDLVKELLTEFVLEGRSEMYQSLKELYKAREWKEKLEHLLNQLEQMNYIPAVYENILIEENLQERMLAYCDKDASKIKVLYPYIIDSYQGEVNQLFTRHIYEQADFARERKEYRGVCQIIKDYKKLFGSDYSKVMIHDLKVINRRRPAFVDELSKIK